MPNRPHSYALLTVAICEPYATGAERDALIHRVLDAIGEAHDDSVYCSLCEPCFHPGLLPVHAERTGSAQCEVCLATVPLAEL